MVFMVLIARPNPLPCFEPLNEFGKKLLPLKINREVVKVSEVWNITVGLAFAYH